MSLDARLRSVELDGIKLAAKGRLVAIGIFAIYAVSSFSGALLFNTLVYLAGFTILALAYLLTAPASVTKTWIRYLLVALEVIILVEAVLTPNPFNPQPWPAAMAFRYDNFYYFFALIAVSVFSYAPMLVLWAGVCTALTWGVGVAIVTARPDVLMFSQVVVEGMSSTELLAQYIDPNVVILSGRFKEMVTALLVSALLAVVVWRGRRTVTQLIAAEADSRLISNLFARYVPREIARTIIEDRGVLEPEERDATVLFADIEAFTSIVERMAPGNALAMLNEYFSAASEIVGEHNGVVTQFQGDAILATFNVPLSDPEHARHAVRAARELLSMVSSRSFSGERLQIRIGISTGPVVAGSVGGESRMSYTVHGDTVNVAARLETINKLHGTRMIIAEATHALLDDASNWRKLPDEAEKGRHRTVSMYAPSDNGG